MTRWNLVYGWMVLQLCLICSDYFIIINKLYAFVVKVTIGHSGAAMDSHN